MAAESPLIRDVRSRGTRRQVPFEIRAGETLDPARVNREVRRLWATGWFDDVRVEAVGAPPAVELVFTFVERPPVFLRRIDFEPASARQEIEVEPGARIDRLQAERLARKLRRQWVEDGYRDARVSADLVPAGVRQADLRMRVERGPQYRIEQVRFSGRLGLDAEALAGALRASHVRRILPGLPGLWGGWRRRPPFSEQGLQHDLESLRSLYLAEGYFDAALSVASLDFVGHKVRVTVAADAGPRYELRGVHVLEQERRRKLAAGLGPRGTMDALCRCLRQAKSEAERQGRLDFAVSADLSRAAEQRQQNQARRELQSDSAAAMHRAPPTPRLVSVTANVEAGPSYTLGRIAFRGHRSVHDTTLRKTLALPEGELFDSAQLRRGLSRLNRLGLLEPLRDENITIVRDPASRQAHLTIKLREAKRGGWSASGPLGPIRLWGPLQFSVASRLPPWGRGVLELTTYYASFSLLSFSQPVWGLLGWDAENLWQPLLALRRPYLPGQRWQSGFVLSPQLGWRGSTAGTALLQGHRTLKGTLEGDPAGAPELLVPLWWQPPAGSEAAADEARYAGTLVCEAPQPRLNWLRSAGIFAVDHLLTPPF